MQNNIYILSDKKVEGAINLPLLDIKFLKPDIDFDQYDGLIFTSQNAIYALLTNSKWKSIPAYAIASKTAQIIKQNGGLLSYIGKYKHGNEFAYELIPLLKGKKVLYIRGSKVVSNLITILNDNGVICDDIVVYQSRCKRQPIQLQPPKNSIIIFSSPSTIQCFLDNFTWDESYRAICIGHTTSKYFPEYIKPIFADDTTLQSCVQKAQEIIPFL